MLKTYLVIFFFFAAHIHTFANDKVDCLFLDQPHQDICLSRTTHLERPDQLTFEPPEKLFHARSYISIGAGLKDASPFPNEYVLSAHYGFQDLPWGWWRIGFAYSMINSEAISLAGIHLNFFYEKRLGDFSFLIGGSYSNQDFSFYDATLRRTVIQPKLGVSYRVNANKRLSFSIDIEADLPWQLVSKENHALSRAHSDEQMRLSQSVDQLDQSWSISAQVGLNYLFE